VTRDEITAELQRIESGIHRVKAALWESRTSAGSIGGADLQALIQLAQSLRERAEHFEETLRDARFLEDLLGDQPL
jgi:hypothetical protein